ncbi:hypothetical protein ScPMuIL_010083 [Solemya velum]
MDYSAEIALLQSTLCLLQKQLGTSTLLGLNKKDCHHVIDVLGGTVTEVLDGLECERNDVERSHWQFKIHSLFLYRTINRHYCHNGGEITPFSMFTHDLPDISKACYWELVKHFKWHDLFMETLHWLDTEVGAELLHDLVEHLQANPVDDQDVAMSSTILDCLCHWILSVPYQRLLALDQRQSDVVIKPENFLSNFANFDCNILQCLIDIIGRKQTSGENLSTEVFEMKIFWQVVVIGLACFGEPTEFQQWIYLNCYCQDKKESLMQVPDLSAGVAELLGKHFSIGDWLNCLSQCLKRDNVLQFFSKTDSTVQQSCVQDSVHLVGQITCDVNSLIRRLCLQLNRESQTESSLTELEKTQTGHILHLMEGTLPKTSTRPEFSITAVLWRINHRLAGYIDCVKNLLTCLDENIWSDKSVISVLRKNVDLLAKEDFIESLMRIISWKKTQKSCFQELEQVTLNAASHLPPVTRDKLIVDLYLQQVELASTNRLFTCDRNFQQQIIAVFNKITSHNWQSVITGTCQLFLVDPVITIQKAVEMFAKNEGQGPLLVKIFQSFPGICQTQHPIFHPQKSLLGSVILDFIAENKLTAAQQQNFMKTLMISIQPFKDGDASLKEALFPVLELLTFSILPFINCDINREGMNPNRTIFALRCLSMVLELEKTCDLQNDWTKLQSISCFVCLSELLHQCIVIWNGTSDEKASVRLQLKELILNCLDLLTEKKDGRSECCANEDSWRMWLQKHVSGLDWTVPIYLNAVLFTSPQKLEAFAKSVFKDQVQDGSVPNTLALLRFSAASDAALEAMTKVMSAFPVKLPYETLILDLVQLLPNLVLREWRNIVHLTDVLIQQGMEVPLRLVIGQSQTWSHDHKVALSTSQMFWDVIVVLNHGHQFEPGSAAWGAYSQLLHHSHQGYY